MSFNLNKVSIAGNLTRDPEAKAVGNSTITKFSIAVNRQWKGNDGEQKKETEFINCEAWGKTAENVARFLTKGSGAYVEGRIKTDTFQDKDGNKRSATKIVADSVQFVGGKPSASTEAAPAQAEVGEEIPF